jgi:hypothetical protein
LKIFVITRKYAGHILKNIARILERIANKNDENVLSYSVMSTGA